MPRIDALFFPGGDGGDLVWPAINAVGQTLRRVHPEAGVWVSAQELSTAGMAAFWRNVTQATTAGQLAGVVYGPHTRVPLWEFVASATAAGGTPVRMYPDITHTLSDQFPLPMWHRAWSLTHGRQTVSPLPAWSAGIISLRANGSTPTVGVGAYSEGLGDDLNKALWSAMAQDPLLSVEAAVQQYARFFFGAPAEALWTAALRGLEQNWHGSPGASNTAIAATLADLVRATTAAGGAASKSSPDNAPTDWRSLMYLKRGYYDAYVQARYVFEVEHLEAEAWRQLATAPRVGSRAAIAAATATLQQKSTNATVAEWKVKLWSLTEQLNATVGAEVLGNQDTGLNMETIDTPLSDATFMLASFDSIASLPTEAARLNAIGTLLNHDGAGPGGYYDNLGATEPGMAPRLCAGQGQESDPSYFFTPLRVAPTPGSVDFSRRLSWSSYAMAFFDASSVTLMYEDLDPRRRYDALVVFNSEAEPQNGSASASTTAVASGEPTAASGTAAQQQAAAWPSSSPGSLSRASSYMRLVADGVTVWPAAPLPYAQAPVPMARTHVPIPAALTADGKLTLSCNQRPGSAGNGRTCQISEVWLVVAD